MDQLNNAVADAVQDSIGLYEKAPSAGFPPAVDADVPMSNEIFQRIPVEIYILIFEFCVADDAQPPYDFFFDDTTKAPWTLGHVCFKWRSIAVDAPSLWTVVCLSTCLLQQASQPEERVAEMWRLYLQRSKTLPISLFVLSEEYLPAAILDPLLDCCERWRDVFLFIHPNHVPRLATIRDRLPLLRSMQFIPTVEVEGNPVDDVPSIVGTAPSLRHLALRGHALDLRLSFPWSQIQIFEANYIEPAEILSIVPAMPHIVRLKLGREPPEHAPVNKENWVVRHDEIRNFTLDTVNEHIEGHPGDLIDHLKLPSLSCLSILCDGEECLEDIHALLKRSACTVETLKLGIRFQHLEGLLNLLHTQPQLKRVSRLSLNDGEPIWGEAFLHALTMSEDDPGSVVMPLLREIDILLDTDEPRVAVQRWLGVFESRVNPVQPADREAPRIQPLLRVEIGSRTRVGIVDNRQTVERLQGLVRAGLQVDIFYRNSID
ncbi:hypothetical protein BD626DRAFT_563189 [Schizophyllum amplum]|uniref:Uncharacterized protein n=1 Tax=Schizophyllum amplum TaxID=97359 RepID=A0A550CXB7_9AGAR|nr:hypothetical protein BD626DRAFT_563189 [Auriculariopsis ampla]